MEELEQLLDQTLNQDLIQIILSNSRDAKQAMKSKVRPVLLKGALLFQETLYRGNQVFHTNYTKEEMKAKILKDMGELFGQAQLKGISLEASVLVSKKGKVTVKKRRLSQQEGQKTGNAPLSRDLSHDRSKRYILQEGIPVDFLVGLGVQTPEGKIVRAKYDKFRQINRYLEFIEDVLDALPKDRCIRIIDFGCGKSYLTFAMYYYLHQLKKREIQVTGLDLKEEVIERCSLLAKSLHYDGLQFEKGDISTYQGEQKIDMVVSLHACDTATDYALEKAVKWGAEVIMAVPCCQHEVNGQIHCDVLEPVLKYGVIKERMSALITDALRADFLEQKGYHTQILEFIDMEHTPKNLLIRAVKTKKMQPGKGKGTVSGDTKLQSIMEFLHIEPTLQKLLKE
ncbi:MAG TPA: SAM-dependent methyltransferase [Candidatus Acetatifactor stercoripullorum]|uniref:SAM-dependent methyltransferase n=1 Tax=Candidatus Acetatifactor stercoripullorum TaxID=2838414 RepID=A0A9D1R4T7_9FIRM|nr:SAM-dependent methyltransferase [uncultured Acetatifactor sp.]HIW81696.1 SAM-dependent methyltransferase [Candidatus Acetatifactor stercoripullorum]